MYTHNTRIRVRYGDTDQMGYVYYGNYARYYEIARVESFRNLGLTYREMEENGIIMPVLENWSKFYKPGLYDEMLTITAKIPELPGVRVTFEYDIINEEEELIHQGRTTLVFLEKNSKKPIRFPEHMLELLRPYYG